VATHGGGLTEHRRGQLYVALAAVAWSTAGILQRELTMDTATQIAGRALFAMLTLLGYVAVTERGNVVPAFRAIGRDGLAVAVCMAIASGAFIVALNHTSVAHVLFIQAAAPVAAALLARAFLGEPITSRTWVAMLVAVGGVGLMIGSPSGGDLRGDLLALGMMFAFAVAIVITRHRRDISMAPAACVAQFMLLVVCAPFASPSQIGPRDLVLLIALGAFQMGLGLVLFTVGARLIPASEAAMITLLEVVLGPLWVWVFLAEKPDTATLVGGAIVIAAVVVQATGPRAALLDTSPAAGP
jgi:drug/metabolite transporter (DMT)-like permease